MGCIQPTPSIPNEDLISRREKRLGIHRHSIPEIKEKFFNLNSQNEIALEKVLIGFGFLGLKFSDVEKDHVLIPFLKGFVDNEDCLDECFEYNFTNLMAVFFLLSSSPNVQKGGALFRFYDTDKSNTLEKEEIEKMLSNLLKIIDIYSQNLVRHDQYLKNTLYNRNQPILDLISDESKLEKAKIKSQVILAKVVPLILDNDDSKHLTEKEFAVKLQHLKSYRRIDLLSTTGIRRLIKETELELKDRSSNRL